MSWVQLQQLCETLWLRRSSSSSSSSLIWRWYLSLSLILKVWGAGWLWWTGLFSHFSPPLSLHFHFLICVTIVFDQELELEKLPFSVKGGDDDGWERCDLIFIHVIIKDWIIHPLLERFIVIANSLLIKRPLSLQLQTRSWSLSRMLCNLHRQLQDNREARWSKINFHL